MREKIVDPDDMQMPHEETTASASNDEAPQTDTESEPEPEPESDSEITKSHNTTYAHSAGLDIE
jgi:hypothetical protein